jgi:hypothetical protein
MKRQEMGSENDEVKGFVKKVLPKPVGLPKDRACLSEDELASFIDGKLKGRKEEALISHLAVCKECLDTIRFLREKPSPEEAIVPAWLEQRVKNLFPAKPKTWEIVLRRVTPFFEIVKHNAELGITLPEFEVVPAGAPFLPKPGKDEIPVAEKPLSYVTGKYQKPAYSDSWKSFKDIVAKEKTMGRFFDGENKVSYAKKDEAYKVIERWRDSSSKGFVFQERLGDYSVYLFLTKREGEQGIEIQIETRYASGEPVEDMEILFVQGRKVLEKLMTEKESPPLRIKKSKRLHIKFKHKGIYLGEAVLSLEK